MYFLKTTAALVASLALSVIAAPTDTANIQIAHDNNNPSAPAVQCGWFYYSGEGQEQALYANGHVENLEQFSVMGSIFVQTCFCTVYKGRDKSGDVLWWGWPGNTDNGRAVKGAQSYECVTSW